MKRLLLLLIFLIPNIAAAATIHGAIYDFSLDKINDAVVSVDTEPKQTYVSKDGRYTFDVPIGDYEISAEFVSDNLVLFYTKEEISVKDDGSYVLDLILFPKLEEELELGEDIGVDIEDDYFDGEKNKLLFNLLIVLGLAVVILVVYYFNKKKKKIETKEEIKGDDLDAIIKIINEEGGRTTQKEIRKKIPLSEAKISLMVAELEHKGKVEKIKKGRGNIIILKK